MLFSLSDQLMVRVAQSFGPAGNHLTFDPVDRRRFQLIERLHDRNGCRDLSNLLPAGSNSFKTANAG